MNTNLLMDRCFREGNRFSPGTGYRVYIAGPISGDLLGNLPAFFEAEEVLRAAGHSTFNPARCDGGHTTAQCIDLALAAEGRKTWTDYMRQGIMGLMRCNAIALLPGWHGSTGANLEQRIAAQMRYAVLCSETGHVLHTRPETRLASALTF